MYNYGTLPTFFQDFIHISRYSRWLEKEGRREIWTETVQRYFDFFQEHLLESHDFDITKNGLREELEQAVLNLEVMPSMRCLMTAGAALKKSHVAAYNCAYTVIDTPRKFDEILYILMHGTGVGFSVERQYVQKLPEVPDELYPTDTTIVVADSKLGWAKALKELVHLLYSGQIPNWDLRKVRPAGSVLKTFGGRASGPEPLRNLFLFTVSLFKQARGRKLTSIECHDLVCKIAEIVVVGGVRRSALISLSNLSDDRMRKAKSGEWWKTEPQRALANNSVAYSEKPEVGSFMNEWLSLYESKSGERGIFNRQAAYNQIRKIHRHWEQQGEQWRDLNHEFGCNPCSEILLRPDEFCNLSEVIVRKDDGEGNIKRKVRLATILGTMQATLSNFPYLSKNWKKNVEDERLLGVSLTGIMDNVITNGTKSIDDLKKVLSELKEDAIKTNLQYADELNINPAKAITCVKPSGTVSSLVDSASGIHHRHSPYYIRAVRADKKDSLSKFMKEKGFPHETDVMNENNDVFYFPMKSPESTLFRNDMSAIEHLELWLIYQEYWCEHKPSITVSVKEHEWPEVGAWVWKHFDKLSGISFLPYTEHIYQQAPFQECTEEEYNDLLKKMPAGIDWKELSKYEETDQTIASQELACSGPDGACSIVDISPQ